MRTRTLARAAALVLAAGGLMVIPASPASAHCDEGHDIHPDRYSGGGIDWLDTPMRHAPHFECPAFVDVDNALDIDVHCAKEIPASLDDWVYARVPQVGPAQGWVRESRLFVPAVKNVPGCADGNLVAIGNT